MPPSRAQQALLLVISEAAFPKGLPELGATRFRFPYAKAIAGVLPTLSNATQLTERMHELADARGIANGRGFYEYTEDEARRWEELFREHAWTVRGLLDKYFPLRP